jgi:redox-sensitive bicupin YhaK (pirin superfamily)
MSMLVIRKPEDIYQIDGEVQDGTFHGRWHFSFGEYYDQDFMHFGTLRVFNDDTLSPGAVWPLHPHRDNEVVTYIAGGEFRHADERGKGGVLKKGWVQHTTVGTGMLHSEINNLIDKPMRFIQMWFLPNKRGLAPSVEQKRVEKKDRTDRFLPLVSNTHDNTLRIVSDAAVYSSFLQKGRTLNHQIKEGWGSYFYVLEGGPVEVNGQRLPSLAAAMVREKGLTVHADEDAELLLVDVLLIENK